MNEYREEAQGRDAAVSAVKALAIVGAVCHHLRNRRLELEAGSTVSVLIVASSWCVLTFIAISGWLHSVSEERQSKSIGEFVSGRARRLLIPFVALVVVYSAVWQLIQQCGLFQVRAAIPVSFAGKVLTSLWPGNGDDVADQLYFLPMLFALASVAQIAGGLLGQFGLFALAVISLACSLCCARETQTTGFVWGVALWGQFFYVAGYLMHRFREWPGARWLAFAFGLGLFAAHEPNALAKAIPLALLAVMKPLRLARLPFISRLGEASGTVFAYHNPFLLQPFLMVAACLPTWRLQVLGVLLSGLLAIVISMSFHEVARPTRLRVLLL